MSTTPIPIRLFLGDHPVHEMGNLIVRPGESIHQALVAALRAAADIIGSVPDLIKADAAPFGAPYCWTTLVNQSVEMGADETGWRTFAATGRMAMICNCGTISGWLSPAEMKPLIEQHGDRSSPGRLMTTAQDSADRPPPPVPACTGSSCPTPLETTAMQDEDPVHICGCGTS